MKRIFAAVLVVALVVVSSVVAHVQAQDAATITIIKDSTPKSTQNFIFSAWPPTPLIGVGNEGGVLPSSFLLDDAVPSDNDLYPKQRSFTLPNGVYTFGETPLSNWILKAIECTAGGDSIAVVNLPNVVITVDGGDVTCTFQNELTASIYTLKYQDTNGNGVRNAGEPALAGWEMTATLQPTGTALAPLVTNTLGRANFQFIKAGTYKVCEALIGGWTNTQPGGAEPCYTVTLAPGQTKALSFGNR